MKSSPSSTARVWREAKSEPDSGSEYPWHHWTSPFETGGRNCCFCSSVPWIIRVGAIIRVPNTSLPGALWYDISSANTTCIICDTPCPPYSSGQAIVSQPLSASFLRICRPKAQSWSGSLSSLLGRSANSVFNHSDSSFLKAISSSENLKSIFRSLSRHCLLEELMFYYSVLGLTARQVTVLTIPVITCTFDITKSPTVFCPSVFVTAIMS